MNQILLFRKDQDTEEEFSVAKDIFKENLVEFRSAIPKKSMVWGRYSCLPYYEELEKELTLNDSSLINSYEQHRYVANIQNWYPDLSHLTPKTYFNWVNLPQGKYVVKGHTNSRKHEWNKRMFAQTREDIPQIANSLLDDCLINEQGICVREYIPLKTYSYGINGLPFTNEWRFFFYKKEIITYGYYWSNSEHEKEAILDMEGINVAVKASEIVSEFINFYVIDIAQTAAGDWIVIELNDAQMSGLSCINSTKFYKSLKSVIC